MPSGKYNERSEKQPLIDKRQLPYTMDAGLGRRARIGLIVLPDDLTIEYELRMIFDLPDVVFYVSRLYCASTITPKTLNAMESEITRAANLIVPGLPLDVVAYGCTSGSLFIGPQKIHARIHETRPGVICTSPIEAAMAAFKILDSTRICLITPYADEINRSLRSHILENGFDVPIVGSWNEPLDARVGRISPESIRQVLLDLGRSDRVDTVFVSCTNLRALGVLKEAEKELGKPVISSNQALGWHCLRLAEISDRLPRFGSLFNH
jgi:maleate isomerase